MPLGDDQILSEILIPFDQDFTIHALAIKALILVHTQGLNSAQVSSKWDFRGMIAQVSGIVCDGCGSVLHL